MVMTIALTGFYEAKAIGQGQGLRSKFNAVGLTSILSRGQFSSFARKRIIQYEMS